MLVYETQLQVKGRQLWIAVRHRKSFRYVANL